MKSFVSIGIVALALSLPAGAADDSTARHRAGPNASTEGGASLGQTGVRSNAGDAARPDSTREIPIRPPRARDEKAKEKPQRNERDATPSSAASGKID